MQNAHVLVRIFMCLMEMKTSGQEQLQNLFLSNLLWVVLFATDRLFRLGEE